MISSLSNPQVKMWVSLQTAKGRNKEGSVLLEGAHLVTEARQAGLLRLTMSTAETALFPDIEHVQITEQIARRLSQVVTSPNLFGIAQLPAPHKLAGKRILVLDKIQNPDNLGTIVRTALGFEIDCLAISSDSCDLYNDKVVRGTQGALFKQPVYRGELAVILAELRTAGYQIIVTDLAARTALAELERGERWALVIGNEAKGVSELAKKAATATVKLPISPQLESLNAAVACGICLYELTKK